ncbi:hypothetical protein [Butyrivibrio sp. YAB3001]|nr:hypothetical protein [Butyrivibrio sp. YAB3001]
MKRDYVLVMKAKQLTERQATELMAKSIQTTKSIAPGRRTVVGIGKRG